MPKQTTVRLPQDLADDAEAIARVKDTSVNADTATSGSPEPRSPDCPKPLVLVLVLVSVEPFEANTQRPNRVDIRRIVRRWSLTNVNTLKQNSRATNNTRVVHYLGNE
ncbi:MAG: hypothetical protein GY926_20035, partial [bacterium]|nr:hypothetical protein [bacterium]MCP4967510.1 hypothetical protein [bacterium]